MAEDDAYLNQQKSLNTTTIVKIFIGDVNDNDPKYLKHEYTANVTENVKQGFIVANVTAVDADTGINGRIWYEITNGNTNNVFMINNKTGIVSTIGEIDRETISSYKLTIKAEDFGFPAPRKASVLLIITVNDRNDNKPLFTSRFYKGRILENQPVNTKVKFNPVIKATDADLDNQMTFWIENNTFFSFEKSEMISNIIFDRETKNIFNFTIHVEDEEGLNSTANVTVVIEDVNDNSPLFDQRVLNISLNESQTINTVVYTVIARDQDLSINSKLSYSVKNGVGRFEVNSKTGEIILISKLDHEIRQTYQLFVFATDGGLPSRQGNMTINVFVKDIIDVAPYFDPVFKVISIYEDTSINSNILTVLAKDNDVNDVITYKFSTNETMFRLNSTTGVISLLNRLDREIISTYTLKIQATDSVGLQTDRDGLTVNINLLDVNDNAPVFSNLDCFENVKEDKADNENIFYIQATDQDEGVNAEVVYSLSSNANKLLGIDPVRGLISKQGDFKPFISKYINFTVYAMDKGQLSKTSNLSCSIYVIDVNDNRPTFNQSYYEIHVLENVTIGYNVVKIVATEKDEGQNALISYFLLGGAGLFAVNITTGQIYTIGQLDREAYGQIVVTLIAQDSSSSPLNGRTSVKFIIDDVNDQAPLFNKVFSFNIDEDAVIGTLVGIVTATDKDEGINKEIRYAMLLQNGQFAINTTTGSITTIGPLDRERAETLSLRIKASDLGTPSLNSYTSVTIKLNDINDNHPRFKQKKYTRVMQENQPIGQYILSVQATDLDVGKNGEIIYTIVNGDGFFNVGETSGNLTVAKTLDVETYRSYNFSIKASDKGPMTLSNYTTVVIMLTDVNDNTPKFTSLSHTFSLYENSTLNTTVGKVTASDADISKAFNQVYYSLQHTHFFIGANTGVIHLKEKLNRESMSSYLLNVVAYNMENGTITLKTTQDVKIIILDVNDNAPVFPPSCCHTSMSESLGINDFVYQFTTTDKDEGNNSLVKYEIISGNENAEFSIVHNSGTLKLSKKVDREFNNHHVLTIRATDSGFPSLSTDALLRITINDINDEEPVFSNITIEIVPENAPIGTYITKFLAIDKDLGMNQILTYSIISGNENGDLFLNGTSGDLKTSKFIDFERTPIYKLQVEAKDHGIPPLSTHHLFEIPIGNVNDNSPIFNADYVIGKVSENAPIGTTVAVVRATDSDNDPIYYYIIGGNEGGSFEITRDGGILKTTKLLDREEKRQYTILVTARNTLKRKKRDTQQLDLIAVSPIKSITVNIEDQNDNPPKFIQNVFSGGVSESAKYGTSILKIQAIDADTGNNSILHYGIVSGNENKAFRLDKLSGWITSEKKFAGKTGKLYNLNVIVQDNNGVGFPYNASAVIKIYVLTDLQRVVITMRTTPQRVKDHQQDFVNILENVTGYLINIDEIQYSTSDGSYDFKLTTLLFHAVDQATNEIVNKDTVVSTMDKYYSKLEMFFTYWNVTKYEGKVSPVFQENVDKTLKIAIAVPVCLVVLFIFFLIFIWRWRRNQKLKLRAVTTSARQSDAELKSIIRDPRIHVELPAVSSSFSYDETPIKLNGAFVIPENNESLTPRQPYSSKFTSFQGGSYTFEPESNSLYLEPNHDDFVKPDVQLDSLTLMDAIAKEGDFSGNMKVPCDNNLPSSYDDDTEVSNNNKMTTFSKNNDDRSFQNKGLDDSDDDSSDTSSITEDDHIITVPVYASGSEMARSGNDLMKAVMSVNACDQQDTDISDDEFNDFNVTRDVNGVLMTTM